MRTRLLLAGLAAVLFACGGGDDSGQTSDPAETGGAEITEDGSGGGGDTGEPVADAEAPSDEEDDGMSCVPVSRCHSFANQDCTLVDADGAIQDEQFSSGSTERACPGERGVAASVTECFDYVEISESCRRRPELRHPEWPCGRTDTARCGIVM